MNKAHCCHLTSHLLKTYHRQLRYTLIGTSDKLKISHTVTMLFSKLAIGSLLALVSSVASVSLTTYSYNIKLIHRLQQVVMTTVTYTASE
jgi:hypothetical protein